MQMKEPLMGLPQGKTSVLAKYILPLFYSSNRPERLLNFWTLRVGIYSKWVLIRVWVLIKFSPFSASVSVFILQQNNKW